MTRGRLIHIDVSNLSKDVFHVYRPSFDLQEFETMIRGYGFVDPWDVELISARYFYDKSYRAIAEEFNYTSFKTVQRRVKELHRLLIERGFKPKGSR